jgi:hypothetical protein
MPNDKPTESQFSPGLERQINQFVTTLNNFRSEDEEQSPSSDVAHSVSGSSGPRTP